MFESENGPYPCWKQTKKLIRNSPASHPTFKTNIHFPRGFEINHESGENTLRTPCPFRGAQILALPSQGQCCCSTQIPRLLISVSPGESRSLQFRDMQAGFFLKPGQSSLFTLVKSSPEKVKKFVFQKIKRVGGPKGKSPSEKNFESSLFQIPPPKETNSGGEETSPDQNPLRNHHQASVMELPNVAEN